MRIIIKPVEKDDVQGFIAIPSKIALIEIVNPTVQNIWSTVQLSCDVMAGYADAELVMLVGVIRTSLLTNSGELWMISTKYIDKHSFLFLRYAQRYLESIKGKYTDLFCMCAGTTEERWLKLLGFRYIGMYSDYLRYKLR